MHQFAFEGINSRDIGPFERAVKYSQQRVGYVQTNARNLTSARRTR